MSKDYLDVVTEVAKQYISITGIRGVALGGSLGRGFNDLYSDVELYIYCDEIPSKNIISHIINNLKAKYTRSHNLHWYSPVWGYHTFFKYKKIKFEVGYRPINEVSRKLNNYLNGKDILPHNSTHDTPFGHYTSGLANCLTECKILYDPFEDIAKLKKIAHNYPNKLKFKVVKYYLKDATQITSSKMRYAYLRDDDLHFNACLSKIIRSIILVIFAVNETHFPGDKWSELYLSKFKIKPSNFDERLKSIFSLQMMGVKNKGIIYQIVNDINKDLKILTIKK